MRLVSFVFLFAFLIALGASPVAAAVMAAVAVLLRDIFMYALGAIIALMLLAYIVVLYGCIAIRNAVFGESQYDIR